MVNSTRILYDKKELRGKTQLFMAMFFSIQANNALIFFSGIQLFHRCSWLSLFNIMKSEPKPFVSSSANFEAKAESGKRQEKAGSRPHLPAPREVLYGLLCKPHESLAITV